MKIAIGPIEGHYGGAAQHILNIVQHSSYDYDLIRIPPFLQKWNKIFRDYLLPIQDNFPHIFLKHNPKRFDMYGWQRYIDFPGRKLARLLKEKDVVHLHGHPYWEQIYNVRGAKIVFTVHNFYNKRDFPAGWERTINYLTNKMIDVCKRADKVISVAKWLRQSLKKNYGVDSEYIPNGVNLEELDYRNGNDFRKKFKIYDDFYLFVGRLTKYKRPELFAELARRMPRRKFVMVGRGLTKDRFKEYYKKNIPANLAFIGELEREDIVNAFDACRTFILPSSNETFGIVLLEAMVCRKPVIAADNLGPKEIIRDGENGFLFEPDNLESLIQKAEIAWYDREIGITARTEIKEKYDWKKIVPEIERNYRD